MKKYKHSREALVRLTNEEVANIHEIMLVNGIKIKDIHECVGLDRFQFGRILNKDPSKRRGLSDKNLFIDMLFSCIESMKEVNNG